MNTTTLVLAAAVLLLAPTAAAQLAALPNGTNTANQHSASISAVGFHFDLFPTVVSAVNGKVGYAPQVWLGVEHTRFRLIWAHLEPPDALAFADEGFENPTTTVVAGVVDYTFGEHFDGFWVTSGLEWWWCTIEHEAVANRAAWSSAIATAGVGYTWRITEIFYVDPWAGAHFALNPETITLGGHRYQPERLIGNASIKVGAMFDL